MKHLSVGLYQCQYYLNHTPVLSEKTYFTEHLTCNNINKYIDIALFEQQRNVTNLPNPVIICL